MASLRSKYDPEAGRWADGGGTAKMPRASTEATPGMLKDSFSIKGQSVPTQPIAARIATLAHQVTEAADLLDEARVRHRTAGEHRSKCEAMFAKAREELLRAMDEYGESTPENVPERP